MIKLLGHLFLLVNIANTYAQDTIVMPVSGNGGFYNSCYAMIVDNGIDSGYVNHSNSTVTISPLWVESISLYFEQFETEMHFDSLCIYDGPGTTFPKIGTYSGSDLQGQTIHSTGNSITLHFISDDIVTAPGFKIWVGCETGVNSVGSSLVSIYPNPVTDFFQMDGLPDDVINSICILDIHGRPMEIKKNNSMINVDHLLPGIYTVLIKTAPRNIIKKIVKI